MNTTMSIHWTTCIYTEHECVTYIVCTCSCEQYTNDYTHTMQERIHVQYKNVNMHNTCTCSLVVDTNFIHGTHEIFIDVCTCASI